MKLWLDDVREMPQEYDVWAKNAHEAIGMLMVENITHIAFDHDLGVERSPYAQFVTGYDVAKCIETLARLGLVGRLEWSIHTDNPSGRKRIRQAMESAERFWSINNESI